MSQREPAFDLDRLRGEQAEALVRNMRTSLLAGACQVKCDDKAAETGNIYLERECLRAPGWMPSGIDDPESKAAVWAYVMYDMRVVVAMPTWLLRSVADIAGRPAECRRGSHPTKGVKLPVDKLLTEARLAALAAQRAA